MLSVQIVGLKACLTRRYCRGSVGPCVKVNVQARGKAPVTIVGGSSSIASHIIRRGIGCPTTSQSIHEMYQSKWADKPPTGSTAVEREAPPTAETATPERKPSRVQNLIRMFSSPASTPTAESPTKSTSPQPPAEPQLTETQSNDPVSPSKESRSKSQSSPAESSPTTAQQHELVPTSSLSAAAPSFSPAPIASPLAPPPDISTSEPFAQTGAGPDDLFDDVVPADPAMRLRQEEDLFSDGFTPAQEVVAESPVAPRGPRGRERGRGDGERGRGKRRGRGRGERGAARDVARENSTPTEQSEQAEVESVPEPTPPDNAPTGPRSETTPAVRGSRLATGGVRKPKLSEAELEARMAAIQIKNASLTAAHARAEADAASFAEREAAAKQQSAQRKKVERKDRQQMMGEREKNRMRKLKAMEGREWELGKREEDFEKGGTFDGKGFGRDQEGYSDGREYLYQEPETRRGRGGGRGRGRGRGRGDGDVVQAPPRQEEFPALPPVGGQSEVQPGKSWADQVESSNAE